MNYYLILLKDGKVVEINNYDNEEARDSYYKGFMSNLGLVCGAYDDVQILNEVR